MFYFGLKTVTELEIFIRNGEISEMPISNFVSQ